MANKSMMSENQQYDEDQKIIPSNVWTQKYTYTANEANDPSTPFKVVKAYKDNGEEIDPAAQYTLIINDFLYGGGDGFSVFKDAKLLGAINPDTEVFIEYIKDLEAAGKTVSAGINGVKTYVTASLEGSTQSDHTGKHEIINRVSLRIVRARCLLLSLSLTYLRLLKMLILPQASSL
ncbi:5'-nucleotidase C-terminal domain-containing protein [Streptococcus equi]|uniref:5'-nucleotidase C-terminal domain-containing protein n=1 Tax=Streptococcus equi TaxID=1336 RepID=UPI001E3C4E45|nr:5'-nucleotidase C-terminal domain-containing protein [Streptococcus equi]